MKGWKKNKEFIESCGGLGIKKIHVIERTYNYGTWRPGDEGDLRGRWGLNK